MDHADPWNEIGRLEQVLEANLIAEIKRSGVRAAAAAFCEDKCRVDGSCPLGHALQTKDDCPLWGYVRATTDAIVPEVGS